MVLMLPIVQHVALMPMMILHAAIGLTSPRMEGNIVDFIVFLLSDGQKSENHFFVETTIKADHIT